MDLRVASASKRMLHCRFVFSHLSINCSWSIRRAFCPRLFSCGRLLFMKNILNSDRKIGSESCLRSRHFRDLLAAARGSSPSFYSLPRSVSFHVFSFSSCRLDIDWCSFRVHERHAHTRDIRLMRRVLVPIPFFLPLHCTRNMRAVCL